MLMKQLVAARVTPMLLLTALVFLSGCASRSKVSGKPPTAATQSTQPSGGYYLDDGPGRNPPPNLDQIADAIPRDEALHRGANKPYTVLGKSYVPNVAATDFKQTGVASWYGRKYHGQKTSIGETYDMYAMTAAHPTLPLPSYVRVTNQQNGKAVVVRVNDRGPFLQDRVIDLSYVAAYKLDYLRQGSARVLVERVFSGQANETPPTRLEIPAPSSAKTTVNTAPNSGITSPTIMAEEGQFYLQLGAFSSLENADNFRNHINTSMSAQASAAADWNQQSISLLQKDNLVRVRVGPVATRAEAETLAKRIREALQLVPIISAR